MSSNFIPTAFRPAPPPGAPPPADCLACRLIGGLTASGLGGYSLVQAYQAGLFARGAKSSGRSVALGVAGVAFLTMGVGRLSGIRAEEVQADQKLIQSALATSSPPPSSVNDAKHVA